jgi:hypothetical protein
MRKRGLLLGSRRPRPLGAIGPHSDGLKLKLHFYIFFTGLLTAR